MKSFTITRAPTWLQITSALGAAASHSLREPHSSDSKWLKLMWRNSGTLMSFETASRISACIPRSPVWKSNGSSSFTRKWLNCKLPRSAKIEMRKISGAISEMTAMLPPQSVF